MSLYNPQYKDGQGNIVDLPINAKKLDGYSYNEYSKYYTTSSTTANAFLVTIPYVKALSDGLVIHCQFHTATKSGATLNVNNLGAKGIYYRYATAITTKIVANNYVDLIYSASIDKWVLLFSYDANSDTLGYKVRTNNGVYYNGASTSCYGYQIVVETNDGLEAFTSANTSTVTSKAQLSPNYIPNGTIRYYSGPAEVKTKVNFSATALWQQYQGINLKYSFNIGTITTNSPCYIKMSRNTDGTLKPVYSATSGGHPLVFALPTTKDGYYYTYLGRTYTSSRVVYLELELCHPTFYYDGGIRVYDGTYLSEETVSNWGFTKNVGTVTSIRVQAGTGLSSSTSTASTTTLDTTISIADGYKLLTTSEYNTLNSKQDKISGGTNGQLLSTNGSSLVWTNDNRSLLHHDLAKTIENTTTDKGWKMFNDTYDGFLLKSLRFQSQSPAWGVGDFGSGIIFGGADTKGVMSVSYGTPKIKFAGGNGNGPKWWIGLTGTSGTTYDLDNFRNKQDRKVTGSWTVSTTNPGPMVDIILAHPDIKIYYKTYTSTTRKTDISSVLFNASHSQKQGIYSLVLKYINSSGNLTNIGSGTIYYEYFD